RLGRRRTAQPRVRAANWLQSPRIPMAWATLSPSSVIARRLSEGVATVAMQEFPAGKRPFVEASSTTGQQVDQNSDGKLQVETGTVPPMRGVPNGDAVQSVPAVTDGAHDRHGPAGRRAIRSRGWPGGPR